ncbi:MAG: AbiH family protein [Dysgonomonas sp.]|nr:AbiH family protein [Dysgonomonas sp.]
MRYNLVIVGNGFDLAHGMRTGYKDFIKHLVDCYCEKGHYSDLFNFDKEIKDYNDLINKISIGKFEGLLVNDYEYWNSYDPRFKAYLTEIDTLTFKNPLVSELLEDLSLQNWCDIEEKYFELLISTKINSPFSNRPEFLNKHFKQLKECLEEYLISQENIAKPLDGYKNFFNQINKNGTLILNFNYTHTLENLYNDETSNTKIIHIHGETNNLNNPIIFGYAALDNESRDLLARNNNEYLRYIKKHLYKRTDNEYKLSEFLNGNKSIYISILGHSCGLSDNLILNQILNHDNIECRERSIRVFYYNEYEKYRDILVNIDRIMNEDKRFRSLIIDFENTDRMPQYDDKEIIKPDFYKFTNSITMYYQNERTYYNNLKNAFY